MRQPDTKYWSTIRVAVNTLFQGLKQTAIHFPKAFNQRNNIGVEQNNYFERKDGLQTLLYPHEKLPVPDNGRYQLHNEIDDCIVCDKCAKVCPVDCIDIEPIKSFEELGKTSDGTTKRIHAAKFDIDMSKCCFCGLCTVVCPTECLTMTNEFDFSEFDVKNHNFVFGVMTPQEIVEKKEVLAKYNEQKQLAGANVSNEGQAGKPRTGKPVFKPRMKPIIKSEEGKETDLKGEKTVFRPKPRMNPTSKSEKDTKVNMEDEKKVVRPKIKMKPIMKKPSSEDDSSTPEEKEIVQKPKVRPKPIMKKKKEGE